MLDPSTVARFKRVDPPFLSALRPAKRQSQPMRSAALATLKSDRSLTLFSSAAAASTETVVDSDAEESGAERNEHDEHGERVDTSEKEHTGPSSSPLSPASSATP
uniref:Uncharacterized protein n=1 Tax=Plectus sambesii TaxID=2011161 RepID=A0A914WF53_9BILA